jgi:ubiquinone/menaquinone biosynthesis C-methylase UbiE
VWILDSQRIRLEVPDVARGAGWAEINLRTFLEALLPRLEASLRVLELGCGGGRTSRHVAPVVRELVCTDVSKTMLKEARENLAMYRNVKFAQTRGYTLEQFADREFDLVFGQGVLSHLDPNPAYALLDEAARVLTPGGLCVMNFFTIDRPAWAKDHLEAVRLSARSGNFGAGQPRPYTADQLDAMYASVGLQVIERRYGSSEEEDSRVPYVLTGEKQESTS